MFHKKLHVLKTGGLKTYINESINLLSWFKAYQGSVVIPQTVENCQPEILIFSGQRG